MAIGIGRLHASDRAASGPLVPGEPHRDQPFMDHVGTDHALGGLDQLLDLGQERIDQLGSLHPLVDRLPGLSFGDVGRTVFGSTPANGAAEWRSRWRRTLPESP